MGQVTGEGKGGRTLSLSLYIYIYRLYAYSNIDNDELPPAKFLCFLAGMDAIGGLPVDR